DALLHGKKFASVLDLAGELANSTRDFPEVHWRALHALAQAHSELGDPRLAEQEYLGSISDIENIRNAAIDDPLEKQRLFENKVSPYRDLAGFYIEQHQPEKAFQYAELAKGRVLLDVLSTGLANRNAAAPPRNWNLGDAIGVLSDPSEAIL